MNIYEKVIAARKELSFMNRRRRSGGVYTLSDVLAAVTELEARLKFVCICRFDTYKADMRVIDVCEDDAVTALCVSEINTREGFADAAQTEGADYEARKFLLYRNAFSIGDQVETKEEGPEAVWKRRKKLVYKDFARMFKTSDREGPVFNEEEIREYRDAVRTIVKSDRSFLKKAAALTMLREEAREALKRKLSDTVECGMEVPPEALCAAPPLDEEDIY